MNYKKETQSAIASLQQHSASPDSLARIYYDEIRGEMPDPLTLYKKLGGTPQAYDLQCELYASLRKAELAALKYELDEAIDRLYCPIRDTHNQRPKGGTLEVFDQQLVALYHEYYRRYTALRYSRNPWQDALDAVLYPHNLADTPSDLE